MEGGIEYLIWWDVCCDLLVYGCVLLVYNGCVLGWGWSLCVGGYLSGLNRMIIWLDWIGWFGDFGND